MSRVHNRFRDLEWYGEKKVIIIGGVGGIGSWLSLFLARMGHELFIYDHDYIEEVNLGGQLYSNKHIGIKKTQGVIENCRIFAPGAIVRGYSLYERDSFSAPIMFSAFDNMAARKLMFTNWCEEEEREIFIDGRLGPEYFEIYCVQKGQEEDYRNTLFNDDEVPDLPCSAKATTHAGAMIASMMTGLLTNYITNSKFGDIREVPFKTQFDIPLIMLTQEP